LTNGLCIFADYPILNFAYFRGEITHNPEVFRMLWFDHSTTKVVFFGLDSFGVQMFKDYVLGAVQDDWDLDDV
jgi:hypothetical protein